MVSVQFNLALIPYLSTSISAALLDSKLSEFKRFLILALASSFDLIILGSHHVLYSVAGQLDSAADNKFESFPASRAPWGGTYSDFVRHVWTSHPDNRSAKKVIKNVKK